MFELDEYLDLLTFHKKHPTAIFADQGMINFMAFRMINQGKLKARQWPLQAMSTSRHWTLVF